MRVIAVISCLLVAACGGASVFPEVFSQERADGKIPVKVELIREQTQKEIRGIPEKQATAERWQAVETDYNACRLLSARKTKAEADKVFAACMSGKGYVYMLRLDAEQLHNDIAGKMVAEKAKRDRKLRETWKKSKQREDELQAAADKEAEKERLAAEKRAEEERLAAEKRAAQKKKDSELYYWATLGNAAKVRALLDDDANPNRIDEQGATALMNAALKGHSEVVKTLLDDRTNLNAADNDGWTALMLVIAKGDIEISKTLLAAGANPNKADKEGATALMFATLKGYSEMVKMLLAAEANPNAAKNNYWTALMLAAKYGHVEITKTLLAAGARPNWIDNIGITALGHAAFYDKAEVVKILLACGASPSIKDKFDKTVWNVAVSRPLILPILEEYMAAREAGWKPQSCKDGVRFWGPAPKGFFERAKNWF